MQKMSTFAKNVMTLNLFLWFFSSKNWGLAKIEMIYKGEG